mmetsp:Transcript_4197/g.8662  ORF Transcript_4197/g.8662 Transcript_4197/m.8662 type:complete len:526 (+) Transcript_4197:144-1721(+)
MMLRMVTPASAIASLVTLLPFFLVSSVHSFSSPSPTYNKIASATSILSPITGEPTSLLQPNSNDDAPITNKKTLVVFLPQLGEFDSFEYCEQLHAAQPALQSNGIDLKLVGIGDATSAQRFCSFTGIDIRSLSLDPTARLYQDLELYPGPAFSLPNRDIVSDDLLKFVLKSLPGAVPETTEELRPVATAWWNYLAMCAGIGAPGTLREILRGYFGDVAGPERFGDEDVVVVGRNGGGDDDDDDIDRAFLVIGPGVGPVKLGPFRYTQWFADERGYTRPVELATVRLRNMVEVLTQWDVYVSDPSTIAQRGGTFLFDEYGNELYSYKSKGVLTYSETMSRPLMFLAPYIGEEAARNPLGLLDTRGGKYKRGRGVLKPAGKVMGLLSEVFKLENRWQAKLLGAEKEDYRQARKLIEETVSNNNIVIYTYKLSLFSAEAMGVLDEIGAGYENVEVGLEWFLLDKEKSVLRAELLKMTGQSSLPHVFINGKHVGGLFTGSEDGTYPGLAGLKESGELMKMVAQGLDVAS